MIGLEDYLFNFHKVILGDPFVPYFLIEIILRSTTMYTYTLINLRLMRTRCMAQLTTFELVIVIALGSAVGDPMFYPEVPLIYGMVTITTMILLTKFISIITERNEMIETIIEGQPRMVIKHGEILKDKLRHADISKEELFSRLRYHGIRNVGQIDYAFIENSGKLSIIRSNHPKEGDSTLDHWKNSDIL